MNIEEALQNYVIVISEHVMCELNFSSSLLGFSDGHT